MFFWRRVAPQVPEDELKPTATPGYTRNFRELNNLVSRGKSFSGYERNACLMNQNGQGFAEVGGLLGVDFADDARAVACIDWDDDGDLDLWVTNRSAPQVRLLKNNQPSSNSSLAIRLVGNGTTTNRGAIGARLVLSRPSESTQQIRTLHAGDGFLSQSSSWIHFGLGQSKEDLQLKVDWPGGISETFADLKAGERYTITQGRTPQRVERFSSRLATSAKNQTLPPKSPVLSRNGLWVANRLPFPRLTWTDQHGASHPTSDLLGQPVVINLWATWCMPCLQELNMFADHVDDLDALGATVLALNVDGLAVDGNAASSANPEEVLNKVGYDLEWGRAEQEDLAKIEILIEHLSSRRAQLSIPSSFLVDANGNVAAIYQEPVSWKQLAGDLSRLDASPLAQLAWTSPRTGQWLTDPRQGIDFEAYLSDYATRLARNGFSKESQRLYQMIKTEDQTENARTYYNQAKLAAQQGLRQNAIDLYREAIRIDPNYGQALTGLGALLLMEKQMEEAQGLFERALRIDPNHATALINLATIDQSRGDNENALGRLRQVVRRNPEYAQAHLNLGSLLASMKQHTDAIHHLSKAIELNPNMVAAHVNLAIAYMQTEQWDQAEVHYRRIPQLSQRMTAYAYYGLGNAQARQKRHADAVASYQRAISSGGKNAQTFTQLGRSLLALGQKEAALHAINSALELDPEYGTAQRLLQGIQAVRD